MNGWPYPVQGPNASGLAAIQQLFEALGLVKPPKVELAEPAIALGGRPGERLEHTLTVTTPENRPIYAHAVSDQPWLTVGKAVCRGRTAALPLTIEAVPHQPGKSLRARLEGDGQRQPRFEVPLVLAVADAPPVGRARRGAAHTHPTAAISGPIVPTAVTPVPPVPAPAAAAARPFADPEVADVELVPAAAGVEPTPVTPPRIPSWLDGQQLLRSCCSPWPSWSSACSRLWSATRSSTSSDGSHGSCRRSTPGRCSSLKFHDAMPGNDFLVLAPDHALRPADARPDRPERQGRPDAERSVVPRHARAGIPEKHSPSSTP